MSSNRAEIYKSKIEKYSSKLDQFGGKKGGIKTFEDILKIFFEHQLAIKLLHFTTKKFSAHKILDDYLSEFRGYVDHFMEVAQGLGDKPKRIDVGSSMSLSINSPTDSNINKFLEDFIKMVSDDGEIRNMIKEMNNNNGLVATLDEMAGSAQKVKYLLTFN